MPTTNSQSFPQVVTKGSETTRSALIEDLCIAGGDGIDGAQHMAQAAQSCTLHTRRRFTLEHHRLHAHTGLQQASRNVSRMANG